MNPDQAKLRSEMDQLMAVGRDMVHAHGGLTTDEYKARIAALEARVREVERSEELWKEEAMRFSRNEEFYKELVVKIGELFGDEAKTSDDGSVQHDVLALKVPELAEAMKSDLAAARATIEGLISGLKSIAAHGLTVECKHRYTDECQVYLRDIAAALVARHQQ